MEGKEARAKKTERSSQMPLKENIPNMHLRKHKECDKAQKTRKRKK